LTLTSKSRNSHLNRASNSKSSRRFVEEGPDTTRERKFKVKTHKRAHYGGFMFSEVKKINTLEDE
jgi:hypothetical protein